MRYRVFVSFDTAATRETGNFAFTGSATTDGDYVPESDPRFDEVHTTVGSLRDLDIDPDDATLYASGTARGCGYPPGHLQDFGDLRAFLLNIEESGLGVHDDHAWYEGSNCSITLVRKYAPDDVCQYFVPGTDDDGNPTQDRVLYRRTIYSFVGISRPNFDLLVRCLKSARGKANIDREFNRIIQAGKVTILQAQLREAAARVDATRAGQDIAAAQMNRAMAAYNEAVKNRTAAEARLNAVIGSKSTPAPENKA